jgi:hypothetical protein
MAYIQCHKYHKVNESILLFELRLRRGGQSWTSPWTMSTNAKSLMRNCKLTYILKSLLIGWFISGYRCKLRESLLCAWHNSDNTIWVLAVQCQKIYFRWNCPLLSPDGFMPITWHCLRVCREHLLKDSSFWDVCGLSVRPRETCMRFRTFGHKCAHFEIRRYLALVLIFCFHNNWNTECRHNSTHITLPAGWCFFYGYSACSSEIYMGLHTLNIFLAYTRPSLRVTLTFLLYCHPTLLASGSAASSHPSSEKTWWRRA